MEKLIVTDSSSQEAQRELRSRISDWLTEVLEFPGYREWKNRQLMQTLLEGHLPGEDFDPIPDFKFPAPFENQIEIVQGYHSILTALAHIRECEFYFRRYPFAGKGVSREAHLRTCCELFLSRVYQFKERWERQLKWLDRRTKPKDLPLSALQEEFKRRFGHLLKERNKLHHQDAYSDVQVNAVGLGDILSTFEDRTEWLKVSRSSYLRIRQGWVKTVKNTVYQLDLFVGLVAELMLSRCRFLPSRSIK